MDLKHVYPILALMLTSSLELLLMNIIDNFKKIRHLIVKLAYVLQYVKFPIKVVCN
jgi:hypothetical protein